MSLDPHAETARYSKTKVLATLGPSDANPVMIEALLVAGVDGFRLDLASGSRTDHGRRLSMIRGGQQQLGQPVAVLAELASPATDEDALWAARAGIDYLGLTFDRPDEITRLKELLSGQATPPQILARVEPSHASEDLPAIVASADGLLLAGHHPAAAAACRSACKPLLVAIPPPQQSPAETVRAMIEGADACLLPTNGATGPLLLDAVRRLQQLAAAGESRDRHAPPVVEHTAAAGVSLIALSLARAAAQIAEEVQAALLVVATASGATARALAGFRCRVPTLGASDSEATLRRMALCYGIVPRQGVPLNNLQQTLQYLVEWGRRNSCLRVGDYFVLVGGSGLADGLCNRIVIHRVPG